MSRNNIYRTIAMKPWAEAKAALMAMSHESLANACLNDQYNEFLSRYADYEVDEKPVDSTLASGFGNGSSILAIEGALTGARTTSGKRLPYIGWFWRSPDWASGRVTIADCGEFVGICEKNKWDYPERRLTAEEVDKVLVVVDAARLRLGRGGDSINSITAVKAELEKMWPLMQTFEVPR